jgi:predicted deacylase
VSETLPRIEILPPDIFYWAAGNTGLPYVWSFDSGKPGPHCAIVALTHGNEYCGAIAVDTLLRAETMPLMGKLSFVFANVDAFLTFDEAAPFKSRSLDEDFNRVWDISTLEGARNSRELTRARALRPFFDTVDHLLDLHSMHEACAPLLLCGISKKGIAQAQKIGAPEHVLIDAGHAAGRRLFDYAEFSNDASPKTAYLLECGQHWAASSVQIAHESTILFLEQFGLKKPQIAPQVFAKSVPQKLIEVTHAITVNASAPFIWTQKWEGLTVVEIAGTALATQAGRTITTPYDNCVLIMPAPEPIAGQTAVRLGRLISG